MQRWLLLLTLCLFSTKLMAEADRVEDILIRGNQKTVTSVIRNLTELTIGQEITERILKNSKDRVTASGLFESVTLSKSRSQRHGMVVLTFTVVEKMSWFMAPVLQFSKDALSGGLVAGESNLFGRNKKAVVFADYGPSNRRFIMALRDPSFMGSKMILALDTVIRWDRMIEYQDRLESRRVKLLSYGATVLPGYKWSRRFKSSLGGYWRRINHTLLNEMGSLRTVDLSDGDDLAAVIKFEYDSLANYHGILDGAKVSVESALSDNRFGSDFNYFKQEVRFTSGIAFRDRSFNWLTKASVQLGKTLPYYKEYTLGGTNLRGYVHRQFRGDTKYTLGQEFIFPIHRFDRFLVRGILFWDSGVLYFKDNKFSRTAWNNGLGGGLRFYLKGIVIPLLGFDAAWSIEDKAFATYLNIGATF